MRGRVVSYLRLTKPILTGLVGFTTAVGFLLASGADVAWARFAWTLVGTLMVAGGANVLNQWSEVRRDALMERTRQRPLPQGAIPFVEALLLGLGLMLAGLILLGAKVHLLTAGLGLLAGCIYLLVYTPLKVRSSLCTLAGACCGAIPPMMGWSAVTGTLDYRAWVLAALLFVWQVPHFLSLAWHYREEYRTAGFRMLPTVPGAERLTHVVVVIYTLSLLPISLLAMMTGMAGRTYALAAVVAGTGLSLLAIFHWRSRTDRSARAAFLASMVYLLVVLGMMIVDRQAPDTARVAFRLEQPYHD